MSCKSVCSSRRETVNHTLGQLHLPDAASTIGVTTMLLNYHRVPKALPPWKTALLRQHLKQRRLTIYAPGLVSVRMVCAVSRKPCRHQIILFVLLPKTYHNIPIRRSAIRSSSFPALVARHPRKRPSCPDNLINNGGSSVAVIAGESAFQPNG